MRRSLIRKLAEETYDKEGINESKAKRVAKVLKREDLKVYIKDLKILDAKRTVKVTVPKNEGISELKNYFGKIYPGKRIEFVIDSSLLTGIKVEDYDNVYELSLKGFLEQAVKGIRYD
jgi:hypothetical protein